MNVIIVGAGALGCFLGGRLARASTVIFMASNTIVADIINKKGISIEELDGRTTKVRNVRAMTSLKDIVEPVDIVIFCVKSHSTRHAVESLMGSSVIANSLLLTLQNGLGNAEILSEFFGMDRVIVGTTAQGSTLIKPGKVRHGGNGPTYIGTLYNKPYVDISQVTDLFNLAGLEVYERRDVETLIWEKLLINVGINAITAVTGILNGGIVNISDARDVCCEAVNEALRVAKKKGILIRDNYYEEVLRVAAATARNRSSMGQDIDRERKTEIDAINGAIVQIGHELGIPTPVNWTLTRLVKILEASRRKGERQ